MSLLTATAEKFQAMGCDVDYRRDDQGRRYAFRTRIRDKEGDLIVLYVGAKKYAYEGRGAFMRDIVEHAEADASDPDTPQAYLLLRLRDAWHVWSPRYYLKHAEESDRDDSPRAKQGEEWLELTTDAAVPFHDVMSGYTEPRQVGTGPPDD